MCLVENRHRASSGKPLDLQPLGLVDDENQQGGEMSERGIIGDRIEAELTAQGMSQAELARRTGLAQSTINGLLNGRSRSSASLHVIARILGVSTSYLSGDIDNKSTSHAEMTATELAEQIDAVLVPVLVSFLEGPSVSSNVKFQMPLARDWLQVIVESGVENAVLAQQSGDAMVPTIGDGDYMLLDLGTREIREHDRIWALSYGGLPMVKRVRAMPGGQWRLSSDSPLVEPLTVEASSVEVVGRVVTVMRRV